MNVTAAVLDDYKILIREHGMTGDAIIMNQNKGTNSYIQDEHRCNESNSWSIWHVNKCLFAVTGSCGITEEED